MNWERRERKGVDWWMDPSLRPRDEPAVKPEGLLAAPGLSGRPLTDRTRRPVVSSQSLLPLTRTLYHCCFVSLSLGIVPPAVEHRSGGVSGKELSRAHRVAEELLLLCLVDVSVCNEMVCGISVLRPSLRSLSKLGHHLPSS